MFKATAATPDGKILVILGLSHKNLDLLKEGSPILVKGSDIGITEDILVFSEDTEETIMKKMKRYIGPNTKVTV
jgi:hypothetical protein